MIQRGCKRTFGKKVIEIFAYIKNYAYLWGIVKKQRYGRDKKT